MATIEWQDGGAGRLDIDGGSVEYAMTGPAPDVRPTIFLLHEGLGCVALWRGFPAALAAATGCGVFVWSRIGYGQSTEAPPPWPVDYMDREATDRLPPVLNAVNPSKAILFGHSDGATIAAIHGGAVSDQRVRALILMAPHFFTEPGGQASIAKIRDVYRTGGLKDRLTRYHANADWTFDGWSGAWLNPGFGGVWNVEDRLGYIRQPALLIQGANDEYGTLAHLDAFERLTAGPVERVVLNDCGHAPHLEKPEATLAAVADFTGRLLALEGIQPA